MTTQHLFPTPARIALLDEIEAGRVFRDRLGESHIRGGARVTGRLVELEAAGWARCPSDEDVTTWRLTAYGSAIHTIRILDFGHHIIAECGDPDEPRVLGDAVKADIGRTWLLTVGAQKTATRNRHAAREELRHAVALVLAAESTVQEGQNP
jgi:hypothetical protein